MAATEWDKAREAAGRLQGKLNISTYGAATQRKLTEALVRCVRNGADGLDAVLGGPFRADCYLDAILIRDGAGKQIARIETMPAFEWGATIAVKLLLALNGARMEEVAP